MNRARTALTATQPCWQSIFPASSAQNGFTITMITATIINSVGTSLA